MENSTKHRWYDVIIAWANGGTVQARSLLGGTSWNSVSNEYTPDFNNTAVEWRVKPKTVTKKYQMALVLQEDDAITVQAFDVTNSGFPVPFIRWIGDTVEVEFSCD